MATSYDYIKRNKRLSILFVVLFPVSFLIFAYLSMFSFYAFVELLRSMSATYVFDFRSALINIFLKTHDLACYVLPVCLLFSLFWGRIAYTQGDQMILQTVHARPVNKWDNIELFSLLENLCITKGFVQPSLFIIEDPALNAFSTGIRPDKASIVVTSGLVEKLNRSETEVVFAQQLAHINNYDIRLMVVLITCVSFFTFAGEHFFYGTEKENYNPERRQGILHPVLMYFGLLLMFYGYFIAPVLKLALSRRREYLADAEAVLTTRHPRALSSALWKISHDSHVRILWAHPSFDMMCIASSGENNWLLKFSGLGRTHPPIELRIKALNDMNLTLFCTNL